jgi:hypothetical protein
VAAGLAVFAAGTAAAAGLATTFLTGYLKEKKIK